MRSTSSVLSLLAIVAFVLVPIVGRADEPNASVQAATTVDESAIGERELTAEEEARLNSEIDKKIEELEASVAMRKESIRKQREAVERLQKKLAEIEAEEPTATN